MLVKIPFHQQSTCRRGGWKKSAWAGKHVLLAYSGLGIRVTWRRKLWARALGEQIRRMAEQQHTTARRFQLATCVVGPRPCYQVWLWLAQAAHTNGLQYRPAGKRERSMAYYQWRYHVLRPLPQSAILTCVYTLAVPLITEAHSHLRDSMTAPKVGRSAGLCAQQLTSSARKASYCGDGRR